MSNYSNKIKYSEDKRNMTWLHKILTLVCTFSILCVRFPYCYKIVVADENIIFPKTYVSREYNYFFCIFFFNDLSCCYYYLAPHRGRARYCNAHVCLCVCVCVFVCPCFRKISKCNISAISQPIIMKLGIHITYGCTP